MVQVWERASILNSMRMSMIWTVVGMVTGLIVRYGTQTVL